MALSEIFRSVFSKPGARPGHGREAVVELCLRASNLTRHTVLADRLDVANHGANRRKGLLGRDELPVGEGLWILPCEAVHTFFMRFPIDLVYLDRKNTVKKVRSSVGPWRLSACLTAHSVLELPSGTVRTTRTQVGDRLEFLPYKPSGLAAS